MSNYTPELEAALKACAASNHGTITYAMAVEFAEDHGLKSRSVISKVKSLGLAYEPKPVKVTKKGEPVVQKRQFVAAIEAALGISAPSLMKVSKADLEALCAATPNAEMPEPEQG